MYYLHYINLLMKEKNKMSVQPYKEIWPYGDKYEIYKKKYGDCWNLHSKS